MVYVLLGTGFEETEAIVPVDLLRRAEIPTATVALEEKTVRGGHGIAVEADIVIDEMDLTDLDMIVLPGGLGGVASIRKSEAAMAAIEFAWKNGKFVAAICAAPTILADLGITHEKSATCYPSMETQMGSAKIQADMPCVRDGNLITGASAGCATKFGLMLISALKGDDIAQRVKTQIVVR